MAKPTSRGKGAGAQAPPSDPAPDDHIAGTSTGPDAEERPPKVGWRNFRLSVNEFLTLIVALGSLAIAALTYKSSLDNTDTREAVNGLVSLAEQTKRQADALAAQNRQLVAQTKSLSDQVNQLTRQADATGQLVEAARDSASSANRQLELAQRSLILNHHARITVEPADISYIYRSYGQISLNFAIKIKNIGDLSANHVSYSAGALTIPAVFPTNGDLKGFLLPERFEDKVIAAMDRECQATSSPYRMSLWGNSPPERSLVRIDQILPDREPLTVISNMNLSDDIISDGFQGTKSYLAMAMVFGCISYYTSDDPKAHLVKFFYLFRSRDVLGEEAYIQFRDNGSHIPISVWRFGYSDIFEDQ